MRILLVSDWYSLSGGAEAWGTWLRSGLRDAGDEVRLLTTSVSAAGRAAADDVVWATDATVGKAFLQIANPFAAATVRRVVRSWRPDAAVVNMFALHLSPSALFALGGVPFLLFVSDYKLICPTGSKLLPDASVCGRPMGRACLDQGCLGAVHGARDLVRYARVRRAVRRAAAVVSCSAAVQASLREHGIGSEVEMLGCPAPLPDFERRPHPDPSFVFVGRLDPEKGVDLLIEAFARLRERVPRARLTIVGRGALRPSLEALSARLGQTGAISFRGWQEPSGVEEELARAWALVAPSRWREPLGLVAVEAMMRGVPAIVADHGGLAETVEPGVSGLRVPPGDAGALAGALADVATGRVFSEGCLAPDVVRRVRARHDLGAHVERVRSRLRALCGL